MRKVYRKKWNLDLRFKMTGKDQEKIRKLGVKIIRRDYSKLLIKCKNQEHSDWVVFEKFATKTALDKKMRELLEDPLTIEC